MSMRISPDSARNSRASSRVRLATETTRRFLPEQRMGNAGMSLMDAATNRPRHTPVGPESAAGTESADRREDDGGVDFSGGAFVRTAAHFGAERQCELSGVLVARAHEGEDGGLRVRHLRDDVAPPPRRSRRCRSFARRRHLQASPADETGAEQRLFSRIGAFSGKQKTRQLWRAWPPSRV